MKKIFSSLVMLLLIFAGAFVFFDSCRLLIAINAKGDSALPVKTQDNLGEIHKGDIFHLDVNYVLDRYAEEHQTVSGIKIYTSYYYYLIPVSTGDDTIKYISLNAKPSMHSTLEKIMQETYAYYWGTGEEPKTSCTLAVQVSTLPADIHAFLNGWYAETQFLGTDVTDYNAYTIPCTLKYLNNTSLILTLLASVAGMAIGVYVLIRTFSKKSRII